MGYFYLLKPRKDIRTLNTIITVIKYKAEICSRKGIISYAIFMTALKAEISTYITKYHK